MYTTRIAGYRGQQGTESPRASSTSPSALPQPLLRLTAMASIGVGAGLYSASAPAEVLIFTFAPAVIAIVVITLQSLFAVPEPASIEETPTEVTDG